MAQHSTAPRSNTTSQETSMSHRGARSEWAHGGMVFAGVLMMVIGIMGILNGIAGIATDDVYANIGSYVFEFSLTTWGWIHLILGIVGVLVAGGLAVGADWARISAIIIASLSIIAQFLWLPYYPAWAILIIVLDLIVIWAVSTWNPTNEYNL